MTILPRLIATVSLILLAFPGILHADEEARDTTAANAPAQTFAQALPQLAADQWKAREDAQKAILELGHADPPTVIDGIFMAYQGSDDPEVRYRLKLVLRELVIQHLFDEKKGFLGVILRPVRRPVRLDQQLIYPLKVRLILPQTTANTGGLAQGDLVIQVQDHLFDKKFGYSQFSHFLAMQAPGQELIFVVWDGEKRIEKKVVLGQPPPHRPDHPPIEQRQQEFFDKWWRAEREDLLDPDKD